MIAAAGLLAQRTGAAKYWAWYDKCWAYAQVTPQRPPTPRPQLTVAAPAGALHRRRARRLVPDGERGQHPRRHARGAGPHRPAGEVLPLEDGLPPAGGVLRGAARDGLRCGGGRACQRVPCGWDGNWQATVLRPTPAELPRLGPAFRSPLAGMPAPFRPAASLFAFTAVRRPRKQFERFSIFIWCGLAIEIDQLAGRDILTCDGARSGRPS